MTEESRTLIQRAFATARESGRPHWHRMSVAVLKNRLLDLTERSFREADYGASTFQEFVRLHSDVLEIDDSAMPPVVTLKGVSAESHSNPETRSLRIRSDLWRAVLDFSSGDRYVWDPAQGLATSEDVSGPQMPTITADAFNEWKRAFAETVGELVSQDRLSEWTEHRRPASFLPPSIRQRWLRHLKAAVRERLMAWFDEQGLEPPVDLLISSESNQLAQTKHLRSRLIDCLLTMTPQELERVQIPATVLLKLKQ